MFRYRICDFSKIKTRVKVVCKNFDLLPLTFAILKNFHKSGNQTLTVNFLLCFFHWSGPLEGFVEIRKHVRQVTAYAIIMSNFKIRG